MQQTLAVLRGLQELDQDLWQVKDELARLPKERDKRRGKIDAELERIAELDRAMFETRVRIKEIEDLTTSQRQRLRKLENEIGASADQALIAAFQHEMRSLRRDISEAEEEGLKLVEQVDRLEKEKETHQAGIDELEKDFAEYAANIDAELQAAEAKRQELDAQRKERLAEPVAPDILTQYEKLLDAREGQAIAELEGRICQGCYVSVPNNIYVRLARGMDLVSCPSCGRILYLADL